MRDKLNPDNLFAFSLSLSLLKYPGLIYFTLPSQSLQGRALTQSYNNTPFSSSTCNVMHNRTQKAWQGKAGLPLPNGLYEKKGVLDCLDGKIIQTANWACFSFFTPPHHTLILSGKVVVESSVWQTQEIDLFQGRFLLSNWNETLSLCKVWSEWLLLCFISEHTSTEMGNLFTN